MPRPLRVLIVEDCLTDAELVVRELRRAGFDPAWKRVDSEADFAASLHPDLDVILCDYSMPGFSGLRALEVLHERKLDMPFIIVSGAIGEDTAVAAMKKGASDYLLKDRMGRLGAAVDLAMEQCRLRKEGERSQEAMRQSEHKYRHLFESLSEAAFLIECSSRRIVDVNRRAEFLLGCTRAEILGKNESSLFSPGKSVENGRHPGNGSPAPLQGLFEESALVTKDGRQVPVQISMAPIDLYGRHLVLELMTDITARKQAENDLLKAKTEAEQANDAKDQFIAKLSHELRTPLTPILLSASDLEEKEDVPEKIRAEMNLIRRNVELEIKLIDDLLDVTRIIRGKIRLHQEIVDAHACLRNALKMVQSEVQSKRLNVVLKLDAERRYVWADPARLQQVFWNLLGNAVKFTPDRGEISVRSANIVDRLHMEFSDTGVGIAPAVLPGLFVAFEQGEQIHTRSSGGLGLGLSIARTVMELHHGTLTAFSEGVDKGATFTLEIETVPDAKEPPVSPRETSFREKGSQTILLVEDHADTLRILTNMLQKWGYKVRTADRVQNALEEAAKDPFDVLVSDLGLPDGSGLEIMHHVKELYGVRGVAISGFGTAEDIRRSRVAGFEEHIVKPVSIQALDAAVQRITAKAA